MILILMMIWRTLEYESRVRVNNYTNYDVVLILYYLNPRIYMITLSDTSLISLSAQVCVYNSTIVNSFFHCSNASSQYTLLSSYIEVQPRTLLPCTDMIMSNILSEPLYDPSEPPLSLVVIR